MSRIRMTIAIETRPLAAPFRVSGYVFDHAEMVIVTVEGGRYRGRGEASGVFYLKDDAVAMTAQLEAARPAIEAGTSRQDLLDLMPAGGGRNAVDSALWDYEAQQQGVPVWRLAGLPQPKPLTTAFTVGAAEPSVMADGATRFGDIAMLKVKLTGDLSLDIARVEAVRAARPDLWIGVDGNQGFVINDLNALTIALVRANVSLLEQPLRRGCEADLEDFVSPIPVAADESLLTKNDLPQLVGRFQIANIKLDKCGGLTAALLLAQEARSLGLRVMVGNMIGTSLGMAPAFLLGQICDVVDLDGPIFLAEDRQPGVRYSSGKVWCSPEVWGGGS